MDFKNKLDLKNADIIIQNIKKIGNIAKKYNIKIGIKFNNKNIIGEVITGKSEYENDVISAIGVLFCKNKKERYEFLYDRICDYLDKKVIDKNICGFIVN